jgi:SAM-dependent methyltransferase
MVSFKSRSDREELMDAPDVSEKDLLRNLRELDILNRRLGGHSISLDGITRLMTDRNKLYHIVDLGCGSGDLLKYIAGWSRSNRYRLKLTGVDKNKDAIRYLNEKCTGYPEIEGVVSDYNKYLTDIPKVDIFHCSLFCHHLNDHQIKQLFRDMTTLAATGFVVNDLQRSAVSYYAVQFLTRVFPASALARHDGPLSVLRAFTQEELKELSYNSGVRDFSIEWRWAFRYLLVARTGRQKTG